MVALPDCEVRVARRLAHQEAAETSSSSTSRTWPSGEPDSSLTLEACDRQSTREWGEGPCLDLPRTLFSGAGQVPTTEADETEQGAGESQGEQDEGCGDVDRLRGAALRWWNGERSSIQFGAATSTPTSVT